MSEESEEDDLIFGPLDEFAHDPKVSDIAVTEQGRVWVDSGDGMKERFARLSFHSPRVVREFGRSALLAIGSQAGRCLPDSRCLDNPGGIRINAVIRSAGSPWCGDFHTIPQSNDSAT
jgi:pilus assembly protein CpaF